MWLTAYTIKPEYVKTLDKRHSLFTQEKKTKSLKVGVGRISTLYTIIKRIKN